VGLTIVLSTLGLAIVLLIMKTKGWYRPLLQGIYVLLKVYIYVSKVYTNAFAMLCQKWRCKGLFQHLDMAYMHLY
jgi:hypothetical protein